MKEATISWEGREITFRYRVCKNIDFVFADVWDKRGESHQFHLNDRGNFIRPISVNKWPEGLLQLVEEILKAETPEQVLDKPGYMWEQNKK